MPESKSPEDYVVAATRLFASRGYHGASISSIAADLGLTKQALLHHFSKKETLYAAVMERLSARLMGQLLDALDDDTPPEDQLELFLLRYANQGVVDPVDIRLVLRALLDDPELATGPRTWHLKEFFETMMALVQGTRRWRGAPAPEALPVICQLLGAVQVFAVSTPSLQGMFGTSAYDTARQTFEDSLQIQIRAILRE